MKKVIVQAVFLALGVTVGSGAALAQQKNDLGKREFDTNCASCHGVDGKGNGPLGELLKRSPPDLTQLAKKNQGILPMGRLYEVIEGAGVPSHGTREMPIWGRDFRLGDAQNLIEARGNYDADALVRARILTLLEYINRLQAK